MRAPPLDECPPGVPSSVPCVACSDISSSLLSASSMMLPVPLPSVEVSLGAAVEVSVPVPFPSVIVLAVQDASIPLVPSARTKASVITAFFIICSNAAFAAFFVFADEKMRSARLFSPGGSVFSRCFCWFLLEIRGNFRN